EVLHVHAGRLCGRSVQPRVQAEIADDEIDPAIAVDVGRNNPIPPAGAVLQTLRRQACKARAGVAEDRDRHPFAHDDEIEAPVAVQVGPQRVGYHDDALQIRGDLHSQLTGLDVSVVCVQV